MAMATSPAAPGRLSIQGSRRSALWLATLGFFGGFAGVAIFGPMVPKFVTILHLTPLEAGVLAGIPNLTGALLRIPFGAWVDRVGGRRPFVTLLLVTIVGVAGLLLLLHNAYPDHMLGLYPILLLLGICIGSGIATFSVGIGQVSYWYPRKQQGGPLGVYAGLGNTAPGLSSWLLPVAVTSLGMLVAYGCWLVALVIITVIYAFGIHDAPYFQARQQGIVIDDRQLAALGEDLIPPGSTWAGLQRAAQSSATWALVFMYFISFGGFLGLTAWLPTFWHSMYATTLTEGGLLTLTFSLLTALVRVPGGLLSDRITIRYALTGNFLLIGLGSLLVATTHVFG
ncbi:MAG: MFS transporter, partial [Chloroflexi bacterium]|nr:MFS transporter [Chloroflexota bacterium]